MIGGTIWAAVAGLSRILDVALSDRLDRRAGRRVAQAVPPGRFDRASLGVYLVLGRSALIAVKPLVSALPAPTLAFVAMGGALHPIGVAFHCGEPQVSERDLAYCVTAAAAYHSAGAFRRRALNAGGE